MKLDLTENAMRMGVDNRPIQFSSAQSNTWPTPHHDKIIIQDFTVEASIGVFEHEKLSRQPVIISLKLDIEPLESTDNHRLDNVVRYDLICENITTLVQSAHIDLVETLAEQIAHICLSYERCSGVEVSVVKPSAINNASGVGVEIYRCI